jgi:hypothetical protein
MNEKWITIKDYPNYMVSDQGQVKCLAYGLGVDKYVKVLTPSSKQTYNLKNDSGWRTFNVSRLVLETFHPQENLELVIKHIDNDHTNNRLDNLYFDKPKETVVYKEDFTKEELISETWLQSVEYPDYLMSSLGRVKKDENILTLTSDAVGYLHVNVKNDSGRITKLVHRLILQTFEPTEDSTLEVNHKDFNKANNRIYNLEWLTHKKNMDHAAENGKMDFRFRTGSDHHAFGIEKPAETKQKMSESHNKNNDHPNYKLTDEQVYQIKKKRFEGTDLESLANEYNQTIGNLSMICSGKRRGKIAPDFTITKHIRIDK